MNRRAIETPAQALRREPRLQSVLLGHTDVLAARRRVLAIAPDVELFDALEGLGGIDRSYAPSAEGLHCAFAPASFDVILADTRRWGVSDRLGAREFAHAARPAGRLILAAATACAPALRRRLDGEGFLVRLAAADARSQVLLAARGG